MSGRIRLLQVIAIPMEIDTATAKARMNRIGVAISSAIVPKPILQGKENTLYMPRTSAHTSTCKSKIDEPCQQYIKSRWARPANLIAAFTGNNRS